MLNSPTRLQAVKPCEKVDKKILSFINKNKNTSPFPQFTNKFFGSRKPKAKSKPIYKTSLADWRSLYQDSERPQTQSHTTKWVINKHRTAQLIKGQIKTVSKNEKSKSLSQNPYKTGFAYSPEKQINNLKKQNVVRAKNIITKSILKGQNPQFSKTAMNFYSSPMKKQIQFLGNLTARLTPNKNSKNVFRTKRSRAFSSFLGN